MNAWTRWKIAFPFIGLNSLVLSAALLGAWAWWSEYGVGYRLLTVLLCLLGAATLGMSVSIGVKPTQDVPWLRIGLVVAGMLLMCGLSIARRAYLRSI